MSYASSMGARVGLVYDAQGVRTGIAKLQAIASLPPFGLPPISSRREKKSPQVDPLTQKPERDNVWFEDARLLCKVLNIIDDLELWHAVALYRMSHGRITSPYMTVINCHSNLTMYKK